MSMVHTAVPLSAEQMWPTVRSDVRTQAEVSRILSGNVLTGAAVTYPSMGIVVWVYHSTVNHLAMYALIAFILVLQSLILFQWAYYKRHVQQREAGGDLAWSVRQLQWASGLSMAIIAGISALAIVIAQSSIAAAPLIASVMVLTYLVGATVADFIHQPAVVAYPFILLGPMALLHATSNQPTQWAMAAFFVFYFGGVISYSSLYSKRLQLAIYQRFELDELAQRLEGEREKAQAAHDTKTRFFASTSHDVRQPLQALSMLLDALRTKGLDASQQQRLLQDMEVNLDALRALFDQVLEVSRLDAGTVQLQPRAVNLGELFERLLSRFEMHAQSKGILLKLRPTQAWVSADPLALERMLANLLGNALKHTPRGGTVWIGWRASRQRVEVRDAGVGIASDEQQRIFDEFYQIGGPGKDHAQGLGLGLAIVRRLAALGGQSVGLRSAPGQGSTFWLSLDSIMPPVAQQASMPMRQAQLGHVLYVENDAILLRVTSSLLRLNGWQVSSCTDPTQALQLLEEGQAFDVLLTDFRMGEQLDGVQLIEKARQLPKRSCLPAVVMTGDGAVAELASMKQLQLASGAQPATLLLHKPVKTVQLIETLTQCLPAHL
jgi:two-component system, sensor histidine kinase